MARILVTGGAGFIGSHLVDKLVFLGHQVTVLDNLSKGKKENVNKNAKLVLGDIRDNLSGPLKNKKFDYVYHLAAQTSVKKSFDNPEENAEINASGSVNVADYCVRNGAKKLIFSSSAAVYSPAARLPLEEESEIRPLSPYGNSKYFIERHLSQTADLKHVCLRYSNVFGPRQDSNGEAGVVSIFVGNALQGKPLRINGDGNQTRDFVYVKDVVAANVWALNLGARGVYNVSTGKESSISWLAGKIIDLTYSASDIEYREGLDGELRRSCLSFGKIGNLGWKPKYSLEKGLRETIDAFE